MFPGTSAFRLSSGPDTSKTFWTHFPAVSGAFLDSPYNGNTSLQTSTSNLEASFARPPEPEEEPKISSDAIWLWIAIIATIGNVVVVAVVCACTF
ncbi:uncharacterized protein C14orf132 isoform X3 [Lepisosteus oculatus]|uniref:uncharacterized protein C14orf132 isoform X3 n=1 Tax=Lepisosteus oculatus TaxID=7918 RepID=UPI00074018F5|nr:PREDICTED: uncharacterized protein C14orf132-like isoform X2 [Lepisosteus oculatus]